MGEGQCFLFLRNPGNRLPGPPADIVIGIDGRVMVGKRESPGFPPHFMGEGQGGGALFLHRPPIPAFPHEGGKGI